MFFIGMLGSLSLEVIKMYEIRNKLPQARYKRLFISPAYWSIVILMSLVGGFFTWAINSGQTATPWQLIVSGAGASGLLRRGIEAQEKSVNLGGEGSSVIRDAFV